MVYVNHWSISLLIYFLQFLSTNVLKQFFSTAINSQCRTYHFMKQKMQRIKIIFENAKVLKQKKIHFSSNGRDTI